MDIRFEWDPAKAEANLRKHGVSFETAARVFSDPFALSEQDRIEGLYILFCEDPVYIPEIIVYQCNRSVMIF